MKEGWGLGHRADPIDPKALKIGAEQEDYRRFRPQAELAFLAGRVAAAVLWPFRSAWRLVRGRPSDGTG